MKPSVEEGIGRNQHFMFRAIGLLIILWGLSQYFSKSVVALNNAGVASFETIETAARVSQHHLYTLEK